jgi:hypothetical protein
MRGTIMIKINYCPIIPSQLGAGQTSDKRGYNHPLFAEGVYVEPKRLIDEDSNHNKLDYYHCPAWRHTASNTFVFYNQMDLDFKYDVNTKQVTANNIQEQHWREFIGFDNQYLQTTGILTAQIGFGAIFWCDAPEHKDLWLNQQPFWNLGKESDLQLIGASMPIGVWSRPVNIALRADNGRINIKRGQPMFTIKFSDYKETYQLVRSVPSDSFMDKVRQYIDVKNYLPKMSWNFIKKKL